MRSSETRGNKTQPATENENIILAVCDKVEHEIYHIEPNVKLTDSLNIQEIYNTEPNIKLPDSVHIEQQKGEDITNSSKP